MKFLRFHRLRSPDLEGIDTIRLVADGCGGQNKNSILIGMFSKWLYSFAPKKVTKIEIIFPVTGHSFIPPDRVFAVIERRIKRKEIIVNPDEYYNIFREYTTVYHLSQDEVEVSDWKSATQGVFKAPGQWHFRFQQTK